MSGKWLKSVPNGVMTLPDRSVIVSASQDNVGDAPHRVLGRSEGQKHSKRKMRTFFSKSVTTVRIQLDSGTLAGRLAPRSWFWMKRSEVPLKHRHLHAWFSSI